MPAKGVEVKAIVIAGGDAAPDDAVHLRGAALVIAADSGAQWVRDQGVRPDLLLGDMDSVDPGLVDALAAEGVAIERHAVEKDASDLELAVVRAAAEGADEVVILGGIGGDRVDHELANLLLLADRRWEGMDLRFVRGDTTVRVLGGGEDRVLDGATGDLVTLLPLGGNATEVRTNGLRFPLDGETLVQGRTRGLSNEVERAPASVSLGGGTLLIIETRKEQPGDHHD
jgi:thiamine pyrophosphokinase